MSEKLCVICKHFILEPWQRGYSEMTPGGDASLDCGKGLISFDLNDFKNQDEFRAAIRTAETCPEYSPEGPK